ncbi:MAG: GNAT family N-acetyltransferase [Nitrospiraceae bacterium]|nr:GNAT family N-acetyltransferase [Nitrospiraceae bacterium]
MRHIFRQAGIEDIPVIRALSRRIWEEAYRVMLSKEQISYMLEMMYAEKVITEELLNGTVWELIVVDGEPRGYLSYSPAEDNSVKLCKLYLEKPYRGTSIAADSLSRVVQYAARNGRDNVFLTVNRNNRAAIRAYEKNGFSVASKVVTDIGGGFVMDDYIMKCEVTPLEA